MKHNYKIIAVDNYGRETISDRLIINRLTSDSANTICAILNKEHEGGDSYYKVVPYEHKLYKYEP